MIGNGNIFVIKAKISPVTIKSFDINMDGPPYLPETVEIYFHPGIAPGFDSPLDFPYTKIFQHNVTGAGRNNVTVLPALQTPVVIPTNSTYSFYVTVVSSTFDNATTSTGPCLWFNVGNAVGDVVASDQYVKIGEGYVVSYPFLDYSKRKRWNGELCY